MLRALTHELKLNEVTVSDSGERESGAAQREVQRERGRAGEQYRQRRWVDHGRRPWAALRHLLVPRLRDCAAVHMLRTNVTDQGGYPAALSAQGFTTANVKDVNEQPVLRALALDLSKSQRATVWTLPWGGVRPRHSGA